MYVKRVRRPGIDMLREAAGILKLILRDLRRGWMYEQGSCRKIRMTGELFEERARFVAFLAWEHGVRGEVLKAIDRLVEYVLKRRRLPKRLKVGGRYVNPARLAEEAIVRKR